MVMCLFIIISNKVYRRLLAQLIKLRAQFPYYPIKNIHLNNAGEFLHPMLLMSIV